jgi:hypothetical protein
VLIACIRDSLESFVSASRSDDLTLPPREKDSHAFKKARSKRDRIFDKDDLAFAAKS